MNVSTVNKINCTSYKAFFAIAGGGQSFIGDYTKIPGASQTIVGAIVPYDQVIFNEFVGEKIEKYVSSETARKLAIASFRQCLKAGVGNWNAVGIGATSSIVKDNERAGREHLFFVAVHSLRCSFFFSLALKQGRTREQEDTIANDLIMLALERATINPNATMPLTLNLGEKMDFQIAEKPDTGVFNPRLDTNKGIVLYPGSFNPLHSGHMDIHAIAEGILGVTPYFELSIANTDKNVVDYFEINKRIESFGGLPYIVTDKATFKDKVKYFRDTCPNKGGIIFVVGADTWERVWMEKYAGPLPELRDYFKANNVRFLVFGRGPIGYQQYGEELRIQSPEAEAFSSSLRSSDIRKQNEN